MKKIMLCAVALTSICTANAQVKAIKSKAPAKKVTVPKMAFKNKIDSFSYAAGLSVANSMQQAGVTNLNTQLVAKGMSDVFNKATTGFTQEQASSILQTVIQEFAKKKADGLKAEGQAFLELNKKRSGIIALPNGLQYEVIKAGAPNGAKPKAIDTVVVNYVGKLTNGFEFDNSLKRGQAATFPLNGVIRGWTEILQLMSKGAHWKVYIPSELAYGEHPPQGAQIPDNAVLVFEIILEDIKPSNLPKQ
ncbi:MAG: FKBP-type peptidyl-prolyl cis-trans isomerase [Ferruginibacter sp.]